MKLYPKKPRNMRDYWASRSPWLNLRYWDLRRVVWRFGVVRSKLRFVLSHHLHRHLIRNLRRFRAFEQRRLLGALDAVGAVASQIHPAVAVQGVFQFALQRRRGANGPDAIK